MVMPRPSGQRFNCAHPPAVEGSQTTTVTQWPWGVDEAGTAVFGCGAGVVQVKLVWKFDDPAPKVLPHTVAHVGLAAISTLRHATEPRTAASSTLISAPRDLLPTNLSPTRSVPAGRGCDIAA